MSVFEELKEQVYQANLALAAGGLVVGTWGNVSGIDADRRHVVIKPSGVPYDTMKAADMVVVSLADGKVAEIGGGTLFTCLKRVDGGIKCFGTAQYGQIGSGDTWPKGDDELPTSYDDVATGVELYGLSYGGSAHICGATAAGGLRCWGFNGNGRLGYGHTDTIGDDELPASAGDVELF